MWGVRAFFWGGGRAVLELFERLRERFGSRAYPREAGVDDATLEALEKRLLVA